MNEILPINSSHYNFRNIYDFKRDNIRSVYYGENSLRYAGPILWSLVPIEIQNCTSLPAFKNCIRSWVPTNCPCRLYLPELKYQKYFIENYLIIFSFLLNCLFICLVMSLLILLFGYL